jgi:hypothetical protein
MSVKQALNVYYCFIISRSFYVRFLFGFRKNDVCMLNKISKKKHDLILDLKKLLTKNS